MSWCGVLEHHADRTPDQAARGATATTSSPTRTWREWSAQLAGGLARAGRRRRRRRRAALVQQPRVPGDDLRRQPPRRDRDADQLAAGGTRAALHPRALRARGRWCATPSSSTSPTTRPSDLDGDLVRVCIGDDAVAGWERFADLRGRRRRRRACPVAADDLHRLMYTSGTTGRPKGVMLTHANLAWKNFAHVTEFGFTADDVGLACGPLYHVGALDLVTTTMIAVGATTIVHRAFDAEQVVDEIERSRVTTIWAAPAMVRAVLDVPGIEQRDLSSVRVIIAGGEKMPIPHHRAHPHARSRRRGSPTRTGSPRRCRATPSSTASSTVSQARQRRPAVPVPRARHLGRARRVGARGRAGRGRAARPEGVHGLLARPRRHRARRSPAAGSTPATSACSTTTATSTSSTGSRT